MKKTALTRKTPMQRTGTPLKRSKLSPRSKKQAGRMERYKRMLESHRKETSKCQWCNDEHNWDQLDFHHPWGRGGEYLFQVVQLCRRCHDEIHAKPKRAFTLGWLQNPIRGQPEDPSSPRPWSELLTEKN